jgi:hypothetical protein
MGSALLIVGPGQAVDSREGRPKRRSTGRRIVRFFWGRLLTRRPYFFGRASETPVELKQHGLVRHVSVSNATAERTTEAQMNSPIVAAQNSEKPPVPP